MQIIDYTIPPMFEEEVLFAIYAHKALLGLNKRSFDTGER
jgi:hypothetical protein